MQDETLLHDADDVLGRNFIVLQGSDGLMAVGVETLSFGVNGLNVKLVEDAGQLAGSQFHSVAITVEGGFLDLLSGFQAVHDGQ